MNKLWFVFVLFFLLMLLGACADQTLATEIPTIHPSAKPLLETLSVMASTANVIAQTATAYAATPTNTATPTETATPTTVPNADEVLRLLNQALEDHLRDEIDTKITVAYVTFGPVGASINTELRIELHCSRHDSEVCSQPQAFVALINTCKNNDKAIEYIATSTQIMYVTILNEVSAPWTATVYWPDMLKYKSGELTADQFLLRIHISQ